MIVVRQDVYASNGLWIVAQKNKGVAYLGTPRGDQLIEALLDARKLFPREQIYLDDRDFSKDIVARHEEKRRKTWGELKLVEYINF